jgi:hypothetical protein
MVRGRWVRGRWVRWRWDDRLRRQGLIGRRFGGRSDRALDWCAFDWRALDWLALDWLALDWLALDWLARRLVRSAQVGRPIATLGGNFLAEVGGGPGGPMGGRTGGLADLCDELRGPGGRVTDDRSRLVDKNRDPFTEFPGDRRDRAGQVAPGRLIIQRIGIDWFGHWVVPPG